MSWTRAELKNLAKNDISNNMGNCIVVILMYSAIASFLSGIGSTLAAFGGTLVSAAISIFALSPLSVGVALFFLKNFYPEKGNIESVFDIFKGKSYLNVVAVQLLTGLFIFLWSLLFIVPGIIKSYEYRMVRYILVDDPSVDYKTAMARSKEMMMGHKGAAFMLDLSFLGWMILSGFTCGILYVVYVGPYMEQTNARLYRRLSGTENIIDTTAREMYGNTNTYNNTYSSQSTYTAPQNRETPVYTSGDFVSGAQETTVTPEVQENNASTDNLSGSDFVSPAEDNKE
ncbi:MAG: DUF975 family protein [Lachnospiraceae bacterium]|nr:DUF975 family protein [Lachnospiraceae bacterium]